MFNELITTDFNDAINLLIALIKLDEAKINPHRKYELQPCYDSEITNFIRDYSALRDMLRRDPSTRNYYRKDLYHTVEYFNKVYKYTFIKLINNDKIYIVNNDSKLVNTIKDEKHLDNLLYHLLLTGSKSKYYTQRNNDDFITNLWALQYAKNRQNIKVDDPKHIQVEKQLRDKINHILKLIKFDSHLYTGDRNPSVYDIFKFYQEVKNKHLTDKSIQMQRYLGLAKPQLYINMLLQDCNADQFNYTHVLTKEDRDYEEANKLAKKILNNRDGRDLKIKEIIEINKPDNKQRGENHITLVHGTSVDSVPSILMNGLLTHTELDEKHQKHHFAGNSLGSGVYFTHPESAGRSIAFGNNGQTTILFVVDVTYDKEIHYQDYGDYQNDENGTDLIIGDKVGYHRHFDEYVVPNSKNIRLKYMIVTK